MKSNNLLYQKDILKVNICFIILFSMLSLVTFVIGYFSSIQNLLISIGEKIISRSLNHKVWVTYFNSISKLFTPVFLLQLFFKLFSTFFVNKCNNSFISLLRCIAMLMVYFLHVSIFTNTRGIPLFEREYMRIFRTPAWGGYGYFSYFQATLREKVFQTRGTLLI